jgi:TPR repeat protein
MNEGNLIELVEKIANENSVPAYQTLGDCLIFKVDINGNPRKIIDEHKLIVNQLNIYANNGNGMCQAMLSVLYLYGIDTLPANFSKAIAYAKRSAGLGEPMGEVALGFAYLTGHGITKDEERALYWFKMAEAKNNPYVLNNIGWMYENGIAHLKSDRNIALRYYRASAEQDNSYGICNVGRCYELGIGVSQDYAAALSWYQKSANKGNPLAQGALATMYEKGVLGIEKNLEKAIHWYLRASWSGRAEFMKYAAEIERLRREGHGESIDKIKQELNL